MNGNEKNARDFISSDPEETPKQELSAGVDHQQFAPGAPSANWLAAIVENSDDAIISKTLQGIITSWNRAAERLFGYSAAEAIGRPITIVIPIDRLHEEDDILAKVRGGERVDHFETVRQRKDGSLIDISLTVSPVRNAQGAIIGASKIARDISERSRERERQVLLLREMNHRIKNLFALINALINMSERSAENTKELAADLRSRVFSLAQAQQLTLPDPSGATTAGSSTSLFALLEAIFAAHRETGRERIEIRGTDISIQGTALNSLALLLHEFSTNAVKYGALSATEGRISIEIACDDELHLTWSETGGPPVSALPQGGGFGTQLERAIVEGALRGSITRDWRSEGLVIRLRVPIHTVN
ncbi:histidine kinase [Rhizobium sp. R72]|uniref:PAS domain S-box protein n=1 Tax=unclassified Rhizobium TaxID=2613769 RepID=UPI000B52C799|nr:MULTISPECIES: PAS domain S-box protein [unclassified Rhizobium]OWW00142.1 histidine kinase [Rhizobium sp. R72]OWW00533.1 histidine kinase [Rhizobium sp. R711]